AAEWLAAVARLAACRSLPETAAHLYGASEALFHTLGEPLVVPPRSLYRRHVAALRETLGDASFAAAWAAGRALPLAQAMVEAGEAVAGPAAGAARADAPTASRTLTPREQDVLQLLAAGWTDREIAGALFLSHRTVNSHVASILAKLGVPSRRKAVACARERALLPPQGAVHS
ncbi:MAG: helix-turn-helix transcriptional regulator, partial [Chloroflexia bacterium]|nr:helix-turn-helix transcriptional regulator [Chloroflexia bacterium]